MISWVGTSWVNCGGKVGGADVETGVDEAQMAGVNVGGGANVWLPAVAAGGALVAVGGLAEVGTMPALDVTPGTAEAVGVVLMDGVSDDGGVMLAVDDGVLV
jgi:hypothetical protein